MIVRSTRSPLIRCAAVHKMIKKDREAMATFFDVVWSNRTLRSHRMEAFLADHLATRVPPLTGPARGAAPLAESGAW